MTKKISEMTPHELELYKIQKEKNKLRMRETYAAVKDDPEFRKRKSLHQKESLKRTGYSRRPDVKKKNSERMKYKYHHDENHRSKVLARGNRGGNGYAKKLEYMKGPYAPIKKMRRQLNAEYEKFMKGLESESADASITTE